MLKSYRLELFGCSDICRKAVVAKQKHNKRTEGDKLEQYDNADYNYWYNQLRKLNKAGNPEAVESFKATLSVHRMKKADVKAGIASLPDFTNCLLLQQSEAGLLIESLEMD